MPAKHFLRAYRATGGGRGPKVVCGWLGPPKVPFYRFFFGWEGSPTKIDYRKKGTLLLTSLLEDLVGVGCCQKKGPGYNSTSQFRAPNPFLAVLLHSVLKGITLC